MQNENKEKNNNILEDKKASKTKTLALMEMVQTVLSLVSQFGVCLCFWNEFPCVGYQG